MSDGEGGASYIFSEAPDLDGMTSDELAKQAIFYGLNPDASFEEIAAARSACRREELSALLDPGC